MTYRAIISTGGVVALMTTTALMTPALAAPSAMVLGISSDGTFVLTSDYDQNGHRVHRYINTRTGVVQVIENPTPNLHLSVVSLSADGTTVIGSYMNVAETAGFVWTAARGFTAIPSWGGPYGSTVANAVNADGMAVAGYINVNNTGTTPIYWTEQDGAIGIGDLGGNDAQGLAISGDGKTVVGFAQDINQASRAFVWSVGQHHIDNIDTMFNSSTATQVSFDGSVVAGTGVSTGLPNLRTFWWAAGPGMVDIGSLGGAETDLSAMSSDGRYLAGRSKTTTNDWQAYRYDAATFDLKNLGTLGGSSSDARDITADGSVVVGTADTANGGARGFYWTEATGMITVEEWLQAAVVPSGTYVAQEVTHVSDDGQVVAGITDDYQTFYARRAKQSGIIKLDEFLPTVAEAGSSAINRHLSNADTIMFGAQGHPMRNLLTDGQRSVWGTIDLGHDQTAQANGNLAVGEFGFGYGFGDAVTARLGIGVVNSSFNLNSGGTVDTSGAYISPEASIALTDSIYATVGGFWSSTAIRSNRGYLNGGVLDYSVGNTQAQTWGVKARVDWLDALVVNDTSFTPYVGLSHARSSVDGYSETGGAFPVTYAPITDQSTIARLGVDVVHPLSDDLRLLVKAEAAHRFEQNSAAVTGSIIGLSGFSLPGQASPQTWVRGGVGLEYDIGGGTASAMVNVTSNGQDPDVWVRANFTLKF